ncbi:uncharacterized protein BO87DRAFT_426280 [Aspergillus neoniger CBS 115656]|uniref:Uncharacterized protein n=1 Tax=Aspergillus neoniger (strain CBS 115656) TaxID=1448310 RepID=A0A318Z1G3_ASPNB|nr:hypothetical protein BO87DRAFT_426280 [Aspergillus neoniger CBS 115656]PYH34008.1 hypothetical protein BO87DRAFT_426280 [Aspergillus neoniger CBS 115656]
MPEEGGGRHGMEWVILVRRLNHRMQLERVPDDQVPTRIIVGEDRAQVRLRRARRLVDDDEFRAEDAGDEELALEQNLLDPGLDCIIRGFFEMGAPANYIQWTKKTGQSSMLLRRDFSTANFNRDATMQTWFDDNRNIQRERRPQLISLPIY